jgi:hypothetical protein
MKTGISQNSIVLMSHETKIIFFISLPSTLYLYKKSKNIDIL